MRRLAIASLFLLAFACTQKPAPVATEVEEPQSADDRPAIAVNYVAVPTMMVRSEPRADAPMTGTYGFNESISVLANSGEWAEIRTFDGTGWVLATDLMNADKAAEFEKSTGPKFYVEPVKIEHARARGEIILEAKVNTSGEVFDVKTLSNTTGIQSLADDNATALKQAKFYPMLTKDGRRSIFVYRYNVYY